MDLLHCRGKVPITGNDHLNDSIKGRKKLFDNENLHHSKNHDIFTFHYEPDNAVYEPPMFAQRRHMDSIQKNVSNAGG